MNPFPQHFLRLVHIFENDRIIGHLKRMLSQTATKEDLIQEFGSDVTKSPDILDELLLLSKQYTVPADVLSSKWEAILLSRDSNDDQTMDLDQTPSTKGNIPTYKHIEELRTSLHREHEARINEKLGFKGGRSSIVKLRPEPSTLVPPNGSQYFDKDSLSAMLEDEDVFMDFAKTPSSRGKVKIRGMGSSATPKPPQSLDSPSYTPAYTPASKQYSSYKTQAPSSSPVKGGYGGGYASSPITKGFGTPSSTTGNFHNRNNRGRVEDIFNSHVPSISKSESNPLRNISALHHQQLVGYRYMFEKLTEMGDLMDDRIDQMAQIIEEYVIAAKLLDMQSQGEEDSKDKVMGILSNPGQVSQEPIFTVGRICCDSPLEDAKLNDSSIMLESSRGIGNGKRIHLDFSSMIEKNEAFALFPGQILGVYGANPTGNKILVSKILLPPPLLQSATSASQLLAMYPSEEKSTKQPMNIFVASGPFSLEDTLEYEPLQALSEVVATEKPDAVVLLGPFIDSAHPALVKAAMSAEEVFSSTISPVLQKMLDSRPNLQLIVIPSTRDFCSEWVGYPQPPLASAISSADAQFRKGMLGLNLYGQEGSKIHLFPNPTQFMINEVLFAVSTADSLMHIGKQEWAKAPKINEDGLKPVDKTSRLFRHMLSQRHLYPLSPPYLSEHFSVDQTRLNSGAVTLQATPDILIVPSILPLSTRNVDNCICINPGQLARMKAGGTFAKMCIHPMDMTRVKAFYEEKRGTKMETDDEETQEDDTTLPHGVDKRTRVEIVRV
ncbi:DNA-directed DNA polymerase alpha subunit pol12 [Phlyctochytrium planicorne]|nr:DNA-directed DNA polymerase alpha subunit pol12 [Phlyctochytrium planicorne]